MLKTRINENRNHENNAQYNLYARIHNTRGKENNLAKNLLNTQK